MIDTECNLIDTEYAVLEIPKNAVELIITGKVYLGGKIRDVHLKLDMDGIREAIKEAEDYFPPDAIFTLTDKGREMAEEMLNG